MNPIGASLWFFQKGNDIFQYDADMNHKKRFVQKSSHKGKKFLPYFSVRFVKKLEFVTSDIGFHLKTNYILH